MNWSFIRGCIFTVCLISLIQVVICLVRAHKVVHRDALSLTDEEAEEVMALIEKFKERRGEK